MANRDYWQKRFAILEESQMNKGAAYFHELEKQYRKAAADIEKDLLKWYTRLAVNNEISMAEAKKLLSGNELEEFRWTVEEYIEKGRTLNYTDKWAKQLENASARVHISRLEAMKIQTQQAIEELYGNELDSFDQFMRDVYTDGYYRTGYEIQKGVGVGKNLMQIDKRKIDKVISKPWAADGSNFSSRIWKQKNQLVSELHTQITQAAIRGQTPEQAIKVIKERFNVSSGQAGRLVMTETAYFHSAGQLDMYKELGVEEYEITAVLDNKTSEICQALDGTHRPLSEFEPGVTAPPFHCWCRTTTVPYFDDEFTEGEMRAARDEDGKTYEVPSNMTYPEWKETFVDKSAPGNNIDLMGMPKNFKNEDIDVKAYKVDGTDNVFTQTHSKDAQNTIDFIERMKTDNVELNGISEIIVAKDINGVAAYDHSTNRMYVNEKISSDSYIKERLSGHYFVAENAEEVIRHELFHKQHWDNIAEKVMTSGKNSDIVKLELESDLKRYIKEQQINNPLYLIKIVSENAHNNFIRLESLNECIAEVLLQEEKGIVNDEELLSLVRGCIK
ncbi:MAG: minor capsid protein [Lachnospiraceae bacterium]